MLLKKKLDITIYMHVTTSGYSTTSLITPVSLWKFLKNIFKSDITFRFIFGRMFGRGVY